MDGLRWRPELAVRNTEPWKDAAELVTLEVRRWEGGRWDGWDERDVMGWDEREVL